MTPTKSVLLLAASGLALTLGGCKVDNRPLLARFFGHSAASPALASSAALPDIGGPPGSAPTAYLPPAQAYPYAERAQALDRVAYQAPPAYAFAYDGEQPWAWQADDDSLVFAEPYDGDDYRFYYYEPDDSYPYFVRDEDYGYAYGPDGALVALFDAAGVLIAADQYGRSWHGAHQYWGRGYDLRRTYGAGRREPVNQAFWAQRAPRLRQVQQSWITTSQRQSAGRGQQFANAALPPPRFATPQPNVASGGQPGVAGGAYGRMEAQGRLVASPPAPQPQAAGGRERGGRPARGQQFANSGLPPPRFAAAPPAAANGGQPGVAGGARGRVETQGGSAARGPAPQPQAQAASGRERGGRPVRGQQFANSASPPQRFATTQAPAQAQAPGGRERAGPPARAPETRSLASATPPQPRPMTAGPPQVVEPHAQSHRHAPGEIGVGGGARVVETAPHTEIGRFGGGPRGDHGGPPVQPQGPSPHAQGGGGGHAPAPAPAPAPPPQPHAQGAGQAHGPGGGGGNGGERHGHGG